jgi:cytochrome P450
MPAITSPATYDPWSPAFVADPYPAYARLRADAPAVYFEPTDQWLISRHADVDALLRDRRLGRSYLHVSTHEEFGREPDPKRLEPFWRVVRGGMLDVEPPDHTRLRRLVSKAFTPRMVARLQPMVVRTAEGLVDELIDAGSDGSPVDMLSILAEPLPVAVIAEMLGIPEGDRHLLRPWSADICGMYELNPSREAEDLAVQAAVEFGDYLRGLAAERRVRPGEDLISALTQVAEQDDVLTEDELVGTCVLLLNAGHEATVNMTGNAWWSLFRNPDQLAVLRSDIGGVLPGALEELMRWDTPAQMFERWVLTDIEVGGVAIPRGAEVALLFGSANRDPEVRSDPDTLDVRRSPNTHLSFGLGAHYCLGAALARMELTASFGAILRRVPGLELVAEPQWKPGYVLRGLEELRVTV